MIRKIKCSTLSHSTYVPEVTWEFDGVEQKVVGKLEIVNEITKKLVEAQIHEALSGIKKIGIVERRND